MAQYVRKAGGNYLIVNKFDNSVMLLMEFCQDFRVAIDSVIDAGKYLEYADCFAFRLRGTTPMFKMAEKYINDNL